MTREQIEKAVDDYGLAIIAKERASFPDDLDAYNRRVIVARKALLKLSAPPALNPPSAGGPPQ